MRGWSEDLCWRTIDHESPLQITYDSIQQLRYAEACLKEAMRVVPIASGLVERYVPQANLQLSSFSIVARTCAKDTFIGTGANRVFIPKGVVVMSDVWTVHYDKTIWGEDADEFRPER